eukprot:TRINITY_DN28243_c0_g1_i1.p1 TRINITY_DN28243_c0_g1~~TRINITY_DN28243_c0_g1_i1.p1  ORF type:complete len:310 (-),score=23.49 TRINITY_DN28243_c0_g1_i1:13-942(-)
MRRHRAATRLQSCQRGRCGRRESQKRLKTIVSLQSWAKSRLERNRYVQLSFCAVQLQRWYHRACRWKRQRRKVNACLLMQRQWRGAMGRRKAAERQAAIVRLQKACRQLCLRWRIRMLTRLRQRIVSSGGYDHYRNIGFSLVGQSQKRRKSINRKRPNSLSLSNNRAGLACIDEQQAQSGSNSANSAVEAPLGANNSAVEAPLGANSAVEAPLGEIIAAMTQLKRQNARLEAERLSLESACAAQLAQLQELNKNSFSNMFFGLYACCAVRDRQPGLDYPTPPSTPLTPLPPGLQRLLENNAANRESSTI